MFLNLHGYKNNEDRAAQSPYMIAGRDVIIYVAYNFDSYEYVFERSTSFVGYKRRISEDAKADFMAALSIWV